MIAEPSLAGAAHVRVSCPSPNATVGDDGRPGVVSGVTGAENALQSPQPASLAARTRKMYGCPLTRPDSERELVTPTDVPSASFTCSSTSVSGEPLEGGRAHVTVAVALSAVACGVDGAPGRPMTVTDTVPTARPDSVRRASSIVYVNVASPKYPGSGWYTT